MIGKPIHKFYKTFKTPDVQKHREIKEQERHRQEQEQQRILESKQMKENIIDVVGKEILIHSHSNLDVIAGDTIMISNIMNKLMMNNKL